VQSTVDMITKQEMFSDVDFRKPDLYPHSTGNTKCLGLSDPWHKGLGGTEPECPLTFDVCKVKGLLVLVYPVRF
jgi:hypothetical protein